MSRPQDKNLIPLTERSEEEAHAIRSAGGKASQEKRRERQMMADLLELYSGLPITDKRKQNRLKKLGIPSEVLTQKMLVADALMRSAQAGNTYAIQLYMDITGETGLGGSATVLQRRQQQPCGQRGVLQDAVRPDRGLSDPVHHH